MVLLVIPFSCDWQRNTPAGLRVNAAPRQRPWRTPNPGSTTVICRFRRFWSFPRGVPKS